MKARKKRITLEVDYSTFLDLQIVFKKVLNHVAKGVKYDRQLISNCLTEWLIYDTEFPDYRIEKINGQNCMIFKSKMNSEK